MARRRGRSEGGVRQIADVAVPVELDPGPAFALIEHNGRLAEQSLRLERRRGVGGAAQGGGRLDDLDGGAFGEVRRLDQASQGGRGEIGADGGGAGIESGRRHGGLWFTIFAAPGAPHAAKT